MLKVITLLFLVAVALVTAATTDRGHYTVHGLGKRKQQILKAGGGIWDLAIAMLESDHMITDYPYGDNKTEDSANFGIFKQNWFMLRTSTSQFKGKTTSQWKEGTILNKKLAQDIKARQESQNFYGPDKWFGGHRFGESGLNNPYTEDITNYKNAVNWIHDQLASDPKYLEDDTRFYVSVVAI
ncbi:hypothetical protein G6F70_000055 [Rhizopus microsporus]|uniref:Uncharacterized protein n=2 Tax=Rhizopus TaxID=4842 RepID=A0A367J446_RHIAZ|nr:hypothetical protein G6F71_001347 [Rhizopus microsporus]RCH84693.1 hypothetical protein CU097_008628 [Rhizopus azygosporus]KAG1204918.1 hypothetical protein G6F70_000055 [Rhizopus microsporus]KAG1216472.1 hypothetical protein G6F69_000043 [Rhizopus microsporus]KAG1238722.1 hypothetical protein G6F67_000197 [Rhizopus microsporus]